VILCYNRHNLNAENSRLFSCSPDLTELDSVHDLLTEAFASAVRRWRGDLPRTQFEFERLCCGIFASAVRDTAPSQFGNLLAGMVEDEISTSVCEAVLHAMAEVVDASNPGLTAHCIAFAAGMHSLLRGVSETTIAEKYGVTRQAVSKRVTAYQRQLHLNPSRGMKSLEAQKVYRARAHRVHGTEPAERESAPVSALIQAIDRIKQFFAGLAAELTFEQRAAYKAQLEPVVALYQAL
jgi:hypothetical protein